MARRFRRAQRPLVWTDHPPAVADDVTRLFRFRLRKRWSDLSREQRSRVLMSMAHELRLQADAAEHEALALTLE